MNLTKLTQLLKELSYKRYQYSELTVKMSELKTEINRLDQLLQWALD